ncbi:hypothetical protein HZU77_002740 [Neisseriaceae bacterium TC5R-5]|nr:hypothetical protein [Neisseriaceae bacterium TC5R-5]
MSGTATNVELQLRNLDGSAIILGGPNSGAGSANYFTLTGTAPNRTAVMTYSVSYYAANAAGAYVQPGAGTVVSSADYSFAYN